MRLECADVQSQVRVRQLCSHANAKLGFNSRDNVQIRGCGADVQIVSRGCRAGENSPKLRKKIIVQAADLFRH